MDTSRPIEDRFLELEHQANEITVKLLKLKTLWNMGYRYLDENDEPMQPDGVVNIHGEGQ